MDIFLKYWFNGFQESLDQIDDSSRRKIFKACGKACSDSYTKQVYLNAKDNSKNEEEFIKELKKAFPEIEIEVIEKERIYSITYKVCACDLVTKKYIDTPYLCECSRNSLLYNWEAISGEGNVKVEAVQTILAGAPCCQFKVTVLQEKEELLHGGNVNEVVRIGNTVHRTRNWSPFVHELLQYLDKQGFEGAPRFIGIDDKGREILSFIPGEVPGNDYPDFKPYIWSDKSLIKSAELLRHYHDAVQGFKPVASKPGIENSCHVPEGWCEEVICHNDAALYNMVFVDEVPIALIDFDLAAPGPRIWDIVYMLYTSVPLASFAIDCSTGKSIPYSPELHGDERRRRISQFFKSYGMEVPQNIKSWTISRIKALCNTLISGAAQGNMAYQKMIEEGHVMHYEDEIIFLQEHFEEWQ